MSVQFVLGSSGVGKSHKIYTEIIKDSIDNPQTNYIVIVPEQFTLQTQKNMVAMHPNKGILNIDVLSFVRLAYKIFNDMGYNPGVILDDAGKNMIIRKIMGYEEENLVLFKANVRKQGFISELKSLISELGQYSITPEDLKDIENRVGDNALKAKLEETQIIYSAFKEYLQEKYIMAEEVLDKLYNVLDKSTLLKDSVICFDGFTGFTPIQYKLLVKIMHICKKVYITTTIDIREVGKKISEYSLFGMSNTTISKVKNLAIENNIEVDKDILVKDYIQVGKSKQKVGRHKNSEVLEHIEQNMFRYSKNVYKNKQDNISIHALASMDEEVDYVIWCIKQLIMDEGLRYRDIAVVTADIENYGRLFNKKLEKNKIPFFLDNNKSIMDNPLVEMIRALFEVLTYNFSYESMFRFLRCGMLDYTSEQIDILENYVLAYGKNKKNHWKKEWVVKDTFYTEEKLEEINLYRKNIYNLLNNVAKSIKDNATVKDISTALYEFLVDNKSSERLGKYKDYFETNNMHTKAKEYSRVYDIVIDLLDKVVDLLGDEKVSIKEYLEIFEAAIEDVKIGVIPMTIDQLVVGDIERTRLSDIKVLFFVGVNENVIPKNATKGGIISELEREILATNGVELSPNKKEELFIEQFYLYMNLTKPSNRLCITFSMVDSDGKALKEAYIVNKICDLVEDISIKYERLNPIDTLAANSTKSANADELLYRKILGNNKGIDYLAYGLRNKSIEDMSDEWKQLYLWYKSSVEGRKILNKMLNEVFYANNETYIDKNVANLIYKNADKSVTEIEKYASCAYAHFLSYGLRLRNRKIYEINLPDVGTLFHSTLDMFSKQLTIDKKSWEEVSVEECEAIIDRCVDSISKEYGSDILYSSKRYEYLVERIKNVTKRTIKTLQNHVKKGKFIPIGYEVKFDSSNKLAATNIELEDGDILGLRGAIDRVDAALYDSVIQEDINEFSQKEELIKVIDYKSSSKKFEPALFMEGIQLQLMVYMSVALDIRKSEAKNKKVRPAGVFYYTIDNPFVEKDEKMSIKLKEIEYEQVNDENIDKDILSQKQRDVIEKSIEDKLTMTGIVNADPKVVEKIDNSIVENGSLIKSAKSEVLKLTVTAKETYRKSESMSTIEDEDFNVLFDKTREIVRQKTIAMKEGNIEKNPYKFGEMVPCQYCDYKEICNFDINLKDNNYKRISKKTLGEVLDVLKLEEDEDIECFKVED